MENGKCRVCCLPKEVLDELEIKRERGETLSALVSDFNSKLEIRKKERILDENEKELSISTLHYHFSRHADKLNYDILGKLEKDNELIFEALHSRVSLFRELIDKYNEIIAVFDDKMQEWKKLLNEEQQLRDLYFSKLLPKYKEKLNSCNLFDENEGGSFPSPPILPSLPGLVEEEKRILNFLEKARKQLSDAIKTMEPEETYILFIQGELNVFFKGFIDVIIMEHKKLETNLRNCVDVSFHEDLRNLLKEVTTNIVTEFSTRWAKKKREFSKIHNELG